MFLQKQPTAGQQGCGQRLQQINVGCWRSIVPAGFHICSRIPWFCEDADAEWVSESLSRKEAWRQLPLSHKIAPLLFPLWFIVTAKQVYVVYPDGVHTQEDNGLMIRLMKTWANLTKRVFLLTQCDWMYGCVGQARLKFVRLPKSSPHALPVWWETARQWTCALSSRYIVHLVTSESNVGQGVACVMSSVTVRDFVCFGASHLGCKNRVFGREL